MTCLSLTLCKKLCNLPKKMFQCLGWMRKKLHTQEFQLRGSNGNMRCKLLQKRFTGKTTVCSKHLRHIAIEKDVLSELNRCTFQISLKYIKLVIPKILFILVLCSLNFYFKIMWLPPLPYQNKNFWPPPLPSEDFSEIFTPPSFPSWRGGQCMPWHIKQFLRHSSKNNHWKFISYRYYTNFKSLFQEQLLDQLYKIQKPGHILKKLAFQH